MKSTAKNTTGLLGGFDFQPIFSEQTLSRSEPKEEENQPSKAERRPSKYRLSLVKPQTAMHSQMKRN